MKRFRKSRMGVVSRDGNVVVTIRKVCRFGNSVYIALPREWLKRHGIREGDELPIVADSILKIVPIERS